MYCLYVNLFTGGGNRIQDMMIEAGIKPAPFIPVSDDDLQTMRFFMALDAF